MRELTELLRRRVVEERAQGRLPSLVIGVGRAGRHQHIEAAGIADLLSGTAVHHATQYRLGSLTKTFTAAVVLLLVERGRLDLDEVVEAHVPGTPLGRATVRQLLAHCGGRAT